MKRTIQSVNDLAIIMDEHRKEMTREEVNKILSDISARLTEKVEKDPVLAAEVDSWTPTDRLVYIVREVYALGAVCATLGINSEYDLVSAKD